MSRVMSSDADHHASFTVCHQLQAYSLRLLVLRFLEKRFSDSEKRFSSSLLVMCLCLFLCLCPSVWLCLVCVSVCAYVYTVYSMCMCECNMHYTCIQNATFRLCPSPACGRLSTNLV